MLRGILLDGRSMARVSDPDAPHGRPGTHDVSLWFYTDQIDNLYQLLKSRQLEAAPAALAGKPGDHAGIEFEQDIEHMFYGARQFCIRDLNGYELYFIRPDEE